MKKYLLVLIGVLVFSLSGCKESDNDEEIIVGDGNDIIDENDPPVSIYDFGNDTISTREEVIEKVVFYQNKIMSFGGEEGEGEMYSPRLLRLSDTDTRYRRDEFTLKDDTETFNAVDVEAMINMNMTIGELKFAIENCDEFIEGEFCTYENELDYNKYLMMKTNEDKLYMESYRYNEEGTVVAAEIFFFDLIDSKVYFEYVRDNKQIHNGSLIEDQYYDKFVEGEGWTSVGVRHGGINLFYQFDNSDGSRHDLFSYYNDELYVNHKDVDKGIEYTANYINGGEVERYDITYYGEYGFLLGYEYSEYIGLGNRRLSWNLFNASGWDEVDIATGEEILYNNGIDITGDLNIFGEKLEVRETVSAWIDLEEDSITQEVLSLSEYGLLIDDLLLADILTDEQFIVDYDEGIESLFGFDKSEEGKKTQLESLFPFTANQSIVDDLLDSTLIE